MDFEISYTDREITPWGGLVLMQQMLRKLSFRDVLLSQPDLPRPGSNRGYDPATIIEGFMTSIWCGVNRFLHTEVTRHDPALSQLFGWQRTPGQDTYKRFSSKFTEAVNYRVSDHLYSWIFDEVQFNNFTLDCDSTLSPAMAASNKAVRRGTIPANRADHHTTR